MLVILVLAITIYLGISMDFQDRKDSLDLRVYVGVNLK